MVGFHLFKVEVLFADWTDAILLCVDFLLRFFVECSQTQSSNGARQKVFVDPFLALYLIIVDEFDDALLQFGSVQLIVLVLVVELAPCQAFHQLCSCAALVRENALDPISVQALVILGDSRRFSTANEIVSLVEPNDCPT